MTEREDLYATVGLLLRRTRELTDMIADNKTTIAEIREEIARITEEWNALMDGMKKRPVAKTILVVDDDPITCEQLATLLRSEGYSVVTALDGRGAMDYLSTEPAPDLILLDMMMPVEDGWRFLDERSRSQSLASIPVVIMTALGVASSEWAAALGAVGLLRKPLEVEALLETTRHHCRVA
ncbi:MAG TPA: response regulator [Gemmataceae bacterium]|nr:response regulator [Gemmataceae bacterium]